MSLGTIFKKPWLDQVGAARQCVAKNDIPAMLNALEPSLLGTAGDRGIAAAAQSIGVAESRIHAAIQFDDLRNALAQFAVAQQNAVHVWTQNQSDWLGVLQNVAGEVLDEHLGNLGFGEWLANFAGGKLRDVRMRQALEALSGQLTAMEQWIERSAALLDSDPELSALWSRADRRARRTAPTFLAAGGLAGGLIAAAGAGLLIVWQARSAGAPSASTIPSVPSTPPPLVVDHPPMPASAAAPASAPSVRVAKPPALSARPSPQRTSAAVPNANGDCSCNGDLVCLMNCPARSSVTAAPVRPVEPAPAPPTSTPSRPACLRSCVAKCLDDPNCERTCAGACPL
jgi:hypothetical protein